MIPELLEVIDEYSGKPDLFSDNNRPRPRRIKRPVVIACVAALLAALAVNIDFPVSGVGKVVPAAPMILQAKEPGVLEKLNYVSGDKISAGDVIAFIKNDDLAKEYSELKLNKNIMNNKLKQLQDKLDYLKIMRARNEELYKENVIALAELEKMRLDYSHEIQQYDILKDEMSILDLKLRVLKESLENTKITSPISGMILDKIEDKKGFVIKKGDEICQIANPDEIMLELAVDETEVKKINVGAPAVIKFLSYPDRVIKGSVVKIDNLAWEKIKKALVKENVINVQIKPGEIPFPVKLGMTANVKIKCGKIAIRKII